ncbi:MAG TPA: hypothetical protein VFP36_06275, partial [Usitatibacter sp.]|nr:hypothetical protein [Usitatibacter sp.]
GLFWGFAIWALYWVVQEWFVHNVVLGNPTWLDLVELAILLLGSLTEGVVIALILARERPRA